MQTARVNLIDWHGVGQRPFARLAGSRRLTPNEYRRRFGSMRRALQDLVPAGRTGRADSLRSAS